MSQDIIKYFAELVREELGICYVEATYCQLESRLQELARTLDLVGGVGELYSLCRTGLTSELKDLILDRATNNETYFFRDPGAFKAIKSWIEVKFSDPKNEVRPFRIWSCAASYGQEAYSMAILLKECLGSSYDEFEIVGTDISGRVLDCARNARYTQAQVQRGLPPGLLVKYFLKEESASEVFWRVRPEITEQVSFRKLNLHASFADMGHFDLILCRNVLIYQSVQDRRRILASIHNALNEKGRLVLGSAESLIGVSDAFKLERVGQGILYRKVIAEMMQEVS